MSYDDSSLRGDEVCFNMDEANNFMNPPSPTGWFFYNLYKGFDLVDEKINDSINNRVLESATGLYLDINWGKKYGIKRDGLSDTIYRKILLAASNETLTVYGIRNTLSKIFECEYEDIIVSVDNTEIIRATDNLSTNTPDTIPDYSTIHGTITKFVTDQIKGSTGNLLIQYPRGIDIEVDVDTTLIDLIEPYIGLVSIRFEEYIK